MSPAKKVSGVKRKQLNYDECSSPSIKVQKVASCGSKSASSRGVADQKSRTVRSRTANPCPRSDRCARTSINGWEWHKWSLNASPAERARVRGIQSIQMRYSGPEVNSMTHLSNSKGLSARTNRVKLRNLLAAAEGADLLKATQLKVIFNMLFEYHGFEMSWSDIVRFKFTSFLGKEKASTISAKQDT